MRGTKLVILKVCWDHRIPFAYSQDNRALNFVAACQICNGIKSSLMFERLEDARGYIYRRLQKKGYCFVSEVPEAFYKTSHNPVILLSKLSETALVRYNIPEKS